MKPIYNPDDFYGLNGIFQTFRKMPSMYGYMVEPDSIPPSMLFDDLSYLGGVFVGSLLVKTTDGLVLIDTTSCAKSAQKNIMEGIQKLGYDPSDIRHIFITHGHFDHYGGARFLKEKTKCNIYMSKIDEDFMNTVILPSVDTDIVQGSEANPGIDTYIQDGDRIRIGDTEFQIYATPGHTPGCVSIIFPVHDGSDIHHVGVWGGTGLPDDKNAAHQYIDSINRFMKIAVREQVDVSLQTHPFFDYHLARGNLTGRIAERKPGEPHPMVWTVERYQLFLQVVKGYITGKLELLEESKQ